MGKLVNLLKYKKPINIKDEKGLAARDEDGNPILVYMRVIGDHAIEEAQKRARLASAILRTKLLNPESEEYIINVAIFDDADRKICMDLIIQGTGANLSGEAFSEVTIPELPKIEEFAIDPDAPTLAELEKLDKAIEDSNKKYQEKLAAYIQNKIDILSKELQLKTDDELRNMAKDNMVIIMSIEEYLNTLRDEKVWRSVYSDAAYLIPEFKTKDEFLDMNAHIKEQLRDEYYNLEQGLDEVKN